MLPAISEVPALPIAYVRALQLMREPDADVQRLSDVAIGDPAFTAALIRLANSAESAPASRIRTPQNAIVRLGVPVARRAILGVTMREAFRGRGGSGIDEDELWRHLVSVGLIADALSWGHGRNSDAFTAGLLHDLGRLVMAAEQPQRYARVVALARRGYDTGEAERQLFGLNHAEWGAACGRQWGFPEDIVDSIADHHDGHDQGLGWVVARAREFSARLGISDGVLEVNSLPADFDASSIPIIGEMGGPDRVLAEVDRFRSVLRRAA
jgi:putative nucleotidyltransferase with HDIG domain